MLLCLCQQSPGVQVGGLSQAETLFTALSGNLTNSIHLAYEWCTIRCSLSSSLTLSNQLAQALTALHL